MTGSYQPRPVMAPNGHTDLIAKLESGERSNHLDVLIEVALFQPDETHFDAVPNAAGTKVIYANRDGSFQTHWAPDWCLSGDKAVALLRALDDGAGHGTASNADASQASGMNKLKEMGE